MVHLITPAVDTDNLCLPPNPRHTRTGLNKIDDLLEQITGPCHLIISGTGRRHTDITHQALHRYRPKVVPVHYSLLCGTADFFDENGGVLLSDGTHVSLNDYFGIPTMYVNVRLFLDTLADHTLVCADSGLFAALELTVDLQPGIHLYVINKDNKIAQCIA